MERDYTPITNNIIKIIDTLLARIESEYTNKSKLEKVVFIEYLQNIVFEIDNNIDSIENYVLRTQNINPTRFKQIKLRYDKLKLQFDEKLLKLKSLGSSTNKQLDDFYRGIDIDLKQESDNIENPNTTQFDELKDDTNWDLGKNTSNIYPEIFKNDEAYNIFLQLHVAYKVKINQVSNYSFVFYAMKKNGFIICKGVNYINFLSENYDISLDRIDSNQSGENVRNDFYESIKRENNVRKA